MSRVFHTSKSIGNPQKKILPAEFIFEVVVCWIIQIQILGRKVAVSDMEWDPFREGIFDAGAKLKCKYPIIIVGDSRPCYSYRLPRSPLHRCPGS